MNHNTNHNKDVVRILRSRKEAVKPVLPFDLTETAPLVFDLSADSREMAGIDLTDVKLFSDYVFDKLRRHDTLVGVGRYNEDRAVYRHHALFDGAAEKRSVHLGIDLFVEAGTEVSTPMSAEVHSFADNKNPGDYGPTIILNHRVQGISFFTLYGHLSAESLSDLYPGRRFAAGEVIAKIGETLENGGWAPHLHFQVITDMGKYQGDFPGVVAPSQLKTYLELCPDPNLLLRIPGLM